MEADQLKAGPPEHQRMPRTRCDSPNLTGVRPMIETYPLDKAAEAYAEPAEANVDDV
jgi:hypothetical protein